MTIKRVKRYNFGYDGQYYDSFVPHDFYGQLISNRRSHMSKPSNYYGPSFWGQDTGQEIPDYYDSFVPNHWNFHRHHNHQPFNFKPKDYDSFDSDENYNEGIPLQIPQNKRPNQNSSKLPNNNQIEYQEESIPDDDYPESSQNTNKETTTERVSIRGRPVIVPTDPPDQIIFEDKPNETEEQRQCVQDCTTSSEYNPVCGTNNVTYFNPGKFKCARECGVDVFIKQDGRCPGGNSVRIDKQS